MTKLSDTYFLKRAGDYSAPLKSAERLPVLYGDLTDGENGNWQLPCLNSTDWVYAYAGHEVLSLANGNSVTIYEDGMLLTGGGVDYTFNAANDYESHGVIATIDMVNPKDNAVITACGMGKPTTSGGATLMDNIIDIVYDFLTVENDFTAALFDSTAKAMARAMFAAQSYTAAGAIIRDAPVWETIVKMMGSFLGSAYINGEGELVLDIDVNTVPRGYADIIPKSEGYLSDVKIRLENIINQCPCDYAYDYAAGAFKSHSDSSAHADSASQEIFGVRAPAEPYPFYWCRDLTSVQAVQDVIVAKLKDPLYEIEITDATVKRIGLDIGDHVAFSAENLYNDRGLQLLNNFWKVISVKPNYSRNNIVFRAIQTGIYMTIAYLADGSYEADGSILAGNNRETITY